MFKSVIINIKRKTLLLWYKFSFLRHGNIVFKGNFWKGHNVEIRTRSNSTIILGDFCAIRDNSSIIAVNHSIIKLGKHVFFNRNCSVCARKEITIEDECIFGPNVCIYDHNHIFNNSGVMPNDYKTKAIIIEKNCWVGQML